MAKLQKSMQFNKKTQCLKVKCNIFDIPCLIWSQEDFDQFAFDDEEVNGPVQFSEFNKNKANFEFVK